MRTIGTYRVGRRRAAAGTVAGMLPRRMGEHFWKAIEEVFPSTRHQRCWVHKTANILNKVARSVQVNMKADLRENGKAVRPDKGSTGKDGEVARNNSMLCSPSTNSRGTICGRSSLRLTTLDEMKITSAPADSSRPTLIQTLQCAAPS
jgi:hypothetical protein